METRRGTIWVHPMIVVSHTNPHPSAMHGILTKLVPHPRIHRRQLGRVLGLLLELSLLLSLCNSHLMLLGLADDNLLLIFVLEADCCRGAGCHYKRARACLVLKEEPICARRIHHGRGSEARRLMVHLVGCRRLGLSFARWRGSVVLYVLLLVLRLSLTICHN